MLSQEAESVRGMVERLLTTNLKRGHDHSMGFDYSYLCSSPHEDKWQRFWDSCFHAIAIAHVDPEQARLELETLAATQAEDGFIGHRYFWGVRLGGLGKPWAFGQAPPGERLRRSALIQPPVFAQAVERVGEIVHDAAFAPPFMEMLDAYHNWLATNRSPDDDGLLVIVSPDESGTDHSPIYDSARGMKGAPVRWRLGVKDRWLDARNWFSGYDSAKMLRSGRFHVKDALVNGLYADSLATMSRMHRTQGNVREADAYAALAEGVTRSMLDKMLDRTRGGFLSLVGADERRVEPLTIGALVPLVMEGVPGEVACDMVESHLLSRDEFWLRYPLPSVAASEPTFAPRDAKLVWRGPTWVNTNWLVWRGLRRHGFHDAADQLATRTVSLVAQAGMRECYNPLNGQGLGARDYGWSALALDMAA